MAFQKYTGPITVDYNCKVTVKNVKYGLNKIAEKEIKNIVKTPVITYTVAANKESATVVVNYGNETNKKYRIDTGSWQDFVGATMTIYKNCTIYTKSINAFGIESTVSSKIITELYHEAPTIISVLSADKAFFTVTIGYSATSAVKQYKIDGGVWQTYTGVLSLYENCTVYAKGANGNGLESSVTNKTLSGIVIDIPVISYSLVSSDTAANITINYGNLATRLYSFDNVSWNNYTAVINVTKDCTIYAKGKTALNVESSVVSKVISGIKSPKAYIVPFSETQMNLTSDTVNIFTWDYASGTKNVQDMQYRENGGAWRNLTGKLTYSSTILLEFKCKGTDGIESNISSFKIFRPIIIPAPTFGAISDDLLFGGQTERGKKIIINTAAMSAQALAAYNYWGGNPYAINCGSLDFKRNNGPWEFLMPIYPNSSNYTYVSIITKTNTQASSWLTNKYTAQDGDTIYVRLHWTAFMPGGVYGSNPQSQSFANPSGVVGAYNFDAYYPAQTPTCDNTTKCLHFYSSVVSKTLSAY